MNVEISVCDDPGDELLALRRWLIEEPAVRRSGGITHADRPSEPGAMGSLDVISLVVGSGLTVAQILASIVAWRATRPRRYLVRVEKDGRAVEVGTDDLAEVDALARQLEARITDEPEAG